MNNSENDKRFCVYVHKDENGNVRYVGSGTIKRAYSKHRRSEEHSILFKNLTVEILFSNINRHEAFEKELELFEMFKGSDLLLNKKAPCVTNKIEYEKFSEYFYYDETSPSGLRWKVHNGAFCPRTIRNKGDVAGSYKKEQYYQVNLFGIRYQVHRIVWALCNKTDLFSYMVVDHIDRNKANNNIENLRLVTYSDNSVNKGLYKNNKSSVSGVYWASRDKAWIVCWTEGTKNNKKYFTVRKLFPEDDFETSKRKAFELAKVFRENIEKNIYDKPV